MHTGKLVWTFRSVPRAGEKYNDTWAGDSWKNRSGVNVWGFITVDVAARHRLHAVRRAVGRSVRRRSRRATTCSAPASSRPTRTPASTSGTSRSCITTSGTPTSPARRRSSTCKQGGKTIPAVAVDQQGRPAVPARSRDRQADLRRRGASGAAERSAARARRRRRSRSRSSRRRSRA